MKTAKMLKGNVWYLPKYLVLSPQDAPAGPLPLEPLLCHQGVLELPGDQLSGSLVSK